MGIGLPERTVFSDPYSHPDVTNICHDTEMWKNRKIYSEIASPYK
jgi:hypothetical protein